MPDSIISILGDSRAFDTYYFNADYPYGYGYQQTFPFLLRKRLLKGNGGLDLAHIPDHFRAGTVQNNILRLGMTNPLCVLLLNGIWETLVNKGHFLEYVKAELERRSTSSGHEWEFSYSGKELARLFVANKLSNSPARYAERQRCIISFFRRRRRQVINVSLPMPDATHLGRRHFAGNHQLINEWDECLAALNEAVRKVVETYGAGMLDAHVLMLENGGQAACLIDQWHFTPTFHAALALELERILPGMLADVPEEHVSHAYMVPGCGLCGPAAVWGEGAEAFLAAHPGLDVEIAPMDAPETMTSDVLVLAVPEEERPEMEVRLMRQLPEEKIIVYPEEVFNVENPLPANKGREG